MVAGGGGAGAGTGTGTADGTTDGTTDGAGGNTAGGTGGIGTEEVPDEQTPLAGNEDSDTSGDNTLLVAGGAGVALVVIIAMAYFLRKRVKA